MYFRTFSDLRHVHEQIVHVERRALPSSLKKLNRELSRCLNKKVVAILTVVGFLAYSRWAAIIAASEKIGFIPKKLFK